MCTATLPNVLQPTTVYFSSRVNSTIPNLAIIIALKPLTNMTKMSDFVLSSFLRSDEAKIILKLAEYVQGSND